MKKILFLVVFSISIESFAKGEETFSLNCKLLDQNIFKLEDGKSEKFGGVDSTASKKIGDTFSVNFRYKDDYILSQDQFFTFHITFMDFIVTSGADLRFLFGSSTPGEYNENNKYEVSKDVISIWNEEGSVKFSRYYKNDWQLSILARGNSFFYDYDRLYIGTANCMGMPDTYDKVLKSMQDVNKIIEENYEQNNLK